MEGLGNWIVDLPNLFNLILHNLRFMGYIQWRHYQWNTKVQGIHFLVWIKDLCQTFLYKKEDICCPLVIQSIHHKNHERRLNKYPTMILS